MNLLPFDAVHAATVASWAASQQEVAMWCAWHEFPLRAHLVAGWQQADDEQAHLLLDGQDPVGYGELWLDDEEDEVELARIAVSPRQGPRSCACG
jgi:hypothetical protein